MATADELLASVNETDRTLVIDSDLRTIYIPADVKNLGVESDDEVTRVYFQMPSEYCGIDLSKFKIRINYLNGNNEGDVYDVDDAVKQSDGTIIFSWLIGRHAASIKGTVTFNVCLKETNSEGVVTREFNTTIATLPILEGLECSEQALQEYNDILEQWRAKLFGISGTEEAKLLAVSQEQQQVISDKGDEVVSDIELKGQETLATIPDDYTAVYKMAEEAQRTKADAIVLEKEGSAIFVDDSADDPLQNLKVYGKTKQDGAPTPDSPVDLESVENPTVHIFGKNLIPNLNEFNGNGITVVRNTDGTVTINGTATTPFGLYSSYIHIPNGTYTLSSNQCMFDGMWMSISNKDLMVFPGEFKKTRDLEGGDHRLLLYLNSGVTLNDFVLAPQLELGEKETEYEPYVEQQTISLDRTLPGIPVTSGGNYTDENGQEWICDEIDFDRGVYVQRINKVSLTGDEAYGYLAESGGEMFVTLSTEAIYTNSEVTCLCNYYPTTARQNTFNNGATIGFMGLAVSHGHIRITDNVRFNGDFDVLRTWVSEKAYEGNPLIIYYILATPIETELTSEEIMAYKALRTNYHNTTVLNDSGAHMVLGYSADTLLYLRDHQPSPTDEQVTNAVNDYLDAKGVQVPSDDHINALIDAALGEIADGTY